MTKREQIISLKSMQLTNSEIARLLQVSRQYVSHVLQTYNEDNHSARNKKSQEFVTVGAASSLLGVSEATVRRWSDQGKLPMFRIGIGRKDRRFNVRDLEKIKIANR